MLCVKWAILTDIYIYIYMVNIVSLYSTYKLMLFVGGKLVTAIFLLLGNVIVCEIRRKAFLFGNETLLS